MNGLWLRLAIASAALAVFAVPTGQAADGPAAVESKVTIEDLEAGSAAGKVKAKGKNVPARVKRQCQRKRQVIVFEEAAPQDFLVGRDLTNKKGKWSAKPTAGTYLAAPHHAIVVPRTVRDRKTERKFRCKGGTSASMSPAVGSG